MPAALSGIEAFAMAALFLALVSRGFRLAVTRRARLALPAFTLKDPPVSGEVCVLSGEVSMPFSCVRAGSLMSVRSI